jgi:hypothetical protein
MCTPTHTHTHTHAPARTHSPAPTPPPGRTIEQHGRAQAPVPAPCRRPRPAGGGVERVRAGTLQMLVPKGPKNPCQPRDIRRSPSVAHHCLEGRQALDEAVRVHEHLGPYLALPPAAGLSRWAGQVGRGQVGLLAPNQPRRGWSGGEQGKGAMQGACPPRRTLVSLWTTRDMTTLAGVGVAPRKPRPPVTQRKTSAWLRGPTRTAGAAAAAASACCALAPCLTCSQIAA